MRLASESVPPFAPNITGTESSLDRFPLGGLPVRLGIMQEKVRLMCCSGEDRVNVYLRYTCKRSSGVDERGEANWRKLKLRIFIGHDYPGQGISHSLTKITRVTRCSTGSAAYTHSGTVSRRHTDSHFASKTALSPASIYKPPVTK